MSAHLLDAVDVADRLAELRTLAGLLCNASAVREALPRHGASCGEVSSLASALQQVEYMAPIVLHSALQDLELSISGRVDAIETASREPGAGGNS